MSADGTPLGKEDFAALVAAVKAAVAEAVAPPALLRDKEARRYVGLKKSAWFRAKAAGKLPAPVDAGDGVLRYRRADLDKFVEKLRPGRRRLRRDSGAA